MGGLRYQKESEGIVDYEIFQIEGSDEWFRGPKFRLIEGEYISFLGAAQTFGTFCKYPFPSILAERLPRQTLNLGIGGAGPGRFLNDDILLDVVNRGRFAVVQVMAGRSADNSEYEAYLGCSTLIKRAERKAKGVPAEEVWAELVKSRSEHDIQKLIDETRQDWMEKMEGLLKKIKVPKTIVWISARSPREYPVSIMESTRGKMTSFPQFVNAPMWNYIRGKADYFVEAVSARGYPQTLSRMDDGMPTDIRRGQLSVRYQSAYPSPQMHEDIADALFPLLRRVLPKPWDKQPAES